MTSININDINTSRSRLKTQNTKYKKENISSLNSTLV